MIRALHDPTPPPMRRLHAPLAALLALTLALSGCATRVERTAEMTRSSASGSGTGGALPDQPVRIPAHARSKLVLVMSGPPTVTGARDWPAFQEEFRAVFAEHAKEAGVAFEVRRDAVPNDIGPGTLVDIRIDDYRMVGIGARILLGVMVGNAYIDARVRFADIATGQTFGEQRWNTTSRAMEGIFGKMTPQQVDAIAAEVFGELKRAN